jgi:hypothetical protein
MESIPKSVSLGYPGATAASLRVDMAAARRAACNARSDKTKTGLAHMITFSISV